MTTKQGPHHEHDCEDCLYVGSRRLVHIEGEPQIWHDFYVCPAEPLNLVYRWGDQGDYGSNARFFPHSTRMQICYELALVSDIDESIKYKLIQEIKRILVHEIEERTLSLLRLDVSDILSVFNKIQSTLYPEEDQ